MDLRNADGGAAEMSGNGIRCLVQAAVDAGWVVPGPVSVATAGGRRTVIYRAGDRPGLGFASVDMGRPFLGPELEPGALPEQIAPSTRFARTVGMGNPHIVLFGEPVDQATVAALGSPLEHSVPGRANVEFVWPGTDPDTLTMRVWERGVGETLACGTGACAVAAAAHAWGLVGPLVLVHSPGGTLQVALGSDDGISLAGPTQKVAEVAIDTAVLEELASAYDDEMRYGLRQSGRALGGARPVTLIERTFRERIILVGVVFPWTTSEAVDADLDELALLVGTAGADVVGRVVQRRDHPDPATFVGRGKAEEIHQLSLTLDSDTVVFDDELTPAQQRNLEKILGRTAIDRTAVILDIFAQNARSQEGKAQVELALLRYRLPRLRGRGTQFSQQAGGIGTRGPGETQLEVDRRRLLQRMARLEGDLRQVSATRRTQRRSRVRGRHRSVSLVGYTNAGKSTLLNRLTDAGVLVQSRPFSTLDPRTRRLDLPGGETVLVSDTVGFVRKLPHQLVEAFRSTLDEVRQAELLLHVVDGSAAEPEAQIDAVRLVLEEIGAQDVPELLVVNKADLSPRAVRVAEDHPGAVVVSARTGQGIDELLRALGTQLRVADRVVELVVPFARGDVLAAVHREGEVVDEVHGEGATIVHVILDEAGRARFRQFLAS